MDCIRDASKCYKKATEASPIYDQICNAYSISILCLSEMLDYMLAVIKQERVPKLEDKIEKWKKDLITPEKIYKGNPEGEALIQSLYILITCIQNLENYKKYGMRQEERAFEECIKELREIANNIESPLQEIIEDSAKKMDVCRLKIMPYAGTETGQLITKPSNFSRVLKWIYNHPIKFSLSVIGSVISGIILKIFFLK